MSVLKARYFMRDLGRSVGRSSGRMSIEWPEKKHDEAVGEEVEGYIIEASILGRKFPVIAFVQYKVLVYYTIPTPSIPTLPMSIALQNCRNLLLRQLGNAGPRVFGLSSQLNQTNKSVSFTFV